MKQFTKDELNQILENVLKQIELYAKTPRNNTQPFVKHQLQLTFPNHQFSYDDQLIRESLLEHTGSLPIIASFLHPYLDHHVDLGKSLIMLSFHDIAEIELGDQMTFTKTESTKIMESEKTLQMLHPQYVEIYKEFESLSSNEARYAKSIDKIAPDFLDYLSGEEYTKSRLNSQVGWENDSVLQKIRDKKRPYMTWSEFLTGIHDALYSKYTQKTTI